MLSRVMAKNVGMFFETQCRYETTTVWPAIRSSFMAHFVQLGFIVAKIASVIVDMRRYSRQVPYGLAEDVRLDFNYRL